jgi:hypothetical protein
MHLGPDERDFTGQAPATTAPAGGTLSPATRCARSPDERRKHERRRLRPSTGPRGCPSR